MRSWSLLALLFASFTFSCPQQDFGVIETQKTPSRLQSVAQSIPSTPPSAFHPNSPTTSNATPPIASAQPTPTIFELASTARETWVFAKPQWASTKLGYLRSGTIVTREEHPSGFHGCHDGWYRIKPHGYVCVGQTATLDIHHPIATATHTTPNLSDLPYTYVLSRNPSPQRYVRLPNEQEVNDTEPDLKPHLRQFAMWQGETSFVAFPEPQSVPSILLYSQTAPGLGFSVRDESILSLGQAPIRSGFALLSTFLHDNRNYGLTTELEAIPLDRTRVVKSSEFHGVTLNENMSLPMAFVFHKRTFRFAGSLDGPLQQKSLLDFRSTISVTNNERHYRGNIFVQAKDGSWLRKDQIVIVDAYTNEPSWAKGDAAWIDVSILRQSLVAYEGTKPVFATLISSGADGLGDPQKTHSTVLGTYLIHTKHISVTMDDDTRNKEFAYRDVPFVQYFKEGYALHAAYWHDAFGTPRSHGCINLSPKDAAWLFQWTYPKVPSNWHAALSLKNGTLVHIHP